MLISIIFQSLLDSSYFSLSPWTILLIVCFFTQIRGWVDEFQLLVWYFWLFHIIKFLVNQIIQQLFYHKYPHNSIKLCLCLPFLILCNYMPCLLPMCRCYALKSVQGNASPAGDISLRMAILFSRCSPSINCHKYIRKNAISGFLRELHFFELHTLKIAFLHFYGIIELCGGGAYYGFINRNTRTAISDLCNGNHLFVRPDERTPEKQKDDGTDRQGNGLMKRRNLWPRLQV